MADPLVSILISVYNAGPYLRSSLESILCQSYSNLEIIIIDDGSTDGCLDTVADVRDSRIKILKQSNSGKSVALNKALEIAQGQFYAIQDADDLSYPDRIESLVKALTAHPQVAGVFSGYDLIINKQHVAPRFRDKSTEECGEDIAQMRMPSHDPTAMFRMSMVRDFRYDPELRIGQGWDYILRVGEKFPLMVIGQCLYSYRINLISNTRSDAKRRAEKVQAVLKRAYARRHRQYPPCINKEGSESEQLYGVVAHFMESVLDLRKAKNYRLALKTAMQSIRLHPLRLSYYKPLMYRLLPLWLIKRYRLFTSSQNSKKRYRGRKRSIVTQSSG
ncbi:MAG: glycosyltransferase [Phycisphaerae bacterium]|nr:glycosyltransferase [Phycisphaerae bacterium]